MLSLFRFHHQSQPAPALGSGLLFNGVVCLGFGIAILMAPDLLAYLVAAFLIVVGITLLSMGWKIRQLTKKR